MNSKKGDLKSERGKGVPIVRKKGRLRHSKMCPATVQYPSRFRDIIVLSAKKRKEEYGSMNSLYENLLPEKGTHFIRGKKGGGKGKVKEFCQYRISRRSI